MVREPHPMSPSVTLARATPKNRVTTPTYHGTCAATSLRNLRGLHASVARVSEVSRWSRGKALLRIAAVVGLFVLAAVTTRRTIEALSKAEPNETCPERISRRYAPLKQHLPPSGVVGYMGPELTEDGCNSKFMAQYVLAPLLVTHVWEEEIRQVARRTDFVVPLKPTLVIVDKLEPLAADWLRDNRDYSVVMDFGDGVLLVGRLR